MSVSLLKRIASLFYEALTIIAIAFVGVGVFVIVVGDASDDPDKRVALQLFIWLLLGAYYVTSWVKRGQSLAMRSWQIKLVPKEDNQRQLPLSVSVAVLRYLLATLSLGFFGFGFFVGLLPKQQFLHDQLLQLRIIDLKKTKTS